MNTVPIKTVRRIIRKMRDEGCQCGSLPPDEQGSCNVCRKAATYLAYVKGIQNTSPLGKTLQGVGS